MGFSLGPMCLAGTSASHSCRWILKQLIALGVKIFSNIFLLLPIQKKDSDTITDHNVEVKPDTINDHNVEVKPDELIESKLLKEAEAKDETMADDDDEEDEAAADDDAEAEDDSLKAMEITEKDIAQFKEPEMVSDDNFASSTKFSTSIAICHILATIGT